MPADHRRVVGDEIEARCRLYDVRAPEQEVHASDDEQDAKRTGHARIEPVSEREGSARIDAMARRRLWWIAIVLDGMRNDGTDDWERRMGLKAL